MKKSSVVKASLCGGVALAIVATVSMPRVSSASLNAEKGLAGISITLDKYCTTEPQETVAAEPTEVTVNGDEIASEAVVNEGSQYDDVAISVANEYVNVRRKASTEAKVVGKLYRGAAATILDTKGEWVHIQSGNCEGYVSADYLATGLKAEEVAEDFGSKIATVNTTTLKVRQKANAESDCLTMIPIGEEYEVLSENDEWVKISIDGGDIKGYVSKEYVDVDMEFDKAITIKEERAAARAARKAEREAAKAAAEQAAAEQAAAEQAASQTTTSTTTTTSSSNTSSTSTSSSTSSSSSNTSTSSSSSSSSSSNSSSSSSSSNSGSSSSTASGSGSAAASYALQFVGNPYVYGGTSLTNGADCSGFVMQVYAHFGISLPHSSASQAGYGTRVSLSEAKAGDLVFYANGGSVNHVGIYIGGGQIVNAACEREGICVKSVNYRTVYCVKRIM